MKAYEGVFIIRPGSSESHEKEIITGIESIISKHEGKIESVTKIPAKNIAYEIKKSRQGIFYQLNFSVDQDKIAPLNRAFRLNQDLVRSMVTVREDF